MYRLFTKRSCNSLLRILASSTHYSTVKHFRISRYYKVNPLKKALRNVLDYDQYFLRTTSYGDWHTFYHNHLLAPESPVSQAGESEGRLKKLCLKHVSLKHYSVSILNQISIILICQVSPENFSSCLEAARFRD